MAVFDDPCPKQDIFLEEVKYRGGGRQLRRIPGGQGRPYLLRLRRRFGEGSDEKKQRRELAGSTDRFAARRTGMPGLGGQ